MKELLFSRVLIALLGTAVGVLATEWPRISSEICYDVLNELEIDGGVIIDRLDNLPLFPESYRKEQMERGVVWPLIQ